MPLHIDACRQANMEKPETISLSRDASGRIYWNDRVIGDTDLADAARNDSPPEPHAHADRNTRYWKNIELMTPVQSAGLQKTGFLTDPRKK